MTPVGIGNNNPGNIKASDLKWMGEIMSDGMFEKFESPVMGIRALMRLLLIYKARYGLDSIRGIINRWAPPNENDTGAYQKSVVECTGFGLDACLDTSDPKVLICLAKSIVRQENGYPKRAGTPAFWYDDSVYEQAAKMALGIK